MMLKTWCGKVWNWILRQLGKQPIYYIGGSEVLPPPLSAEEEAAQVVACQAGSAEARNTLIEHNLRLVVFLARKFESSGVGTEDLISIGTIGLIKAVGTYKSDKNVKLATYASRCIENEILMHLRKISGQRTEISFDEPLSSDWDGNELLLSDILGTEADSVLRPLEDDVDRALLLRALDLLPAREKQIISLRFGIGRAEPLTQKEVADLLGISQSYISRLEKRIIARMRKDILKWV
nr:RNA polymerase sporulation sigma factor SigE [Butyricicoccus sp. Marseille-Q5471]